MPPGYPGGAVPALPPHTYQNQGQQQYQMQQAHQMSYMHMQGGMQSGYRGKHAPDKQNKINRELHVGNTNPQLTAPQLESFLNAAMLQGGLTTGPGPCVNTVRCR
jgi:hypothetical protein